MAASQAPGESAAEPSNEPAKPDEAAPAQVARPVEGGRCAKVWDALDKAVKDKGEAPTLQEVQKLAKRKRWNANTARVQYYRWKSAQTSASAS